MEGDIPHCQPIRPARPFRVEKPYPMMLLKPERQWITFLHFCFK